MSRKSRTAAAAGNAPPSRKRINLALQGGGAHGAFGWGVMDGFLEDGRIEIEGLSGTSAGSMNAVVYAYGRLKGHDSARQALHDFWKDISDTGQRFAIPNMPWAAGPDNPLRDLMRSFMGVVSPYQVNPLNWNPLRQVLQRHVDFRSWSRAAG
jgi:NTE family protein